MTLSFINVLITYEEVMNDPKSKTTHLNYTADGKSPRCCGGMRNIKQGMPRFKDWRKHFQANLKVSRFSQKHLTLG